MTSPEQVAAEALSSVGSGLTVSTSRLAPVTDDRDLARDAPGPDPVAPVPGDLFPDESVSIDYPDLEPVGRRRRGAAELGRAASLSPSERVIPTWTDPTAARAADAIGGPLGRHALVGRAAILTPLRVCLIFAICALIGGWLFKAACIQQGPNGSGGVSLDQSGQRPWIAACYNDVVPLYGSRGFDHPEQFPYSHSWVDLTDGGEKAIWDPADVKTVDNQLVAVTAGRTVTIGDGDFVGTPDAGYSEVTDGALVPVADISDRGQVRYLEYPVLTGVFQWGVSWANRAYLDFARSSGLVPVPLDVAAYFTIGAIFLGLLYLWAVASTAKIARRRIWDTAIMCLSPLLIVHAFTNWDAIAIAFCAAGMLAWARRHPTLAGVLLGLGMAAKLYPILLLGPLLALCLRTGKMPAWFKAALGAAVAWLAVNLPVILQYPQAWYEFIRLNSERGAEWDTWYFIYSNLSGSKVFDNHGARSPEFLNNLSLALFAVSCLAIGWFALSARRRPRFAQLAFLVVAAFLLTNKVWSPQYSLWLLPLVVLALPRWRPVLLWQCTEVVTWVLLMFQFAGVENKGLSVYPFICAALLRDVFVIALMLLVIRDVLRPDRDLVRMAGDDDPSGGVLEDAPDRWTVPSLPTLLGRLRGRPQGAHAATAARPQRVPAGAGVAAGGAFGATSGHSGFERAGGFEGDSGFERDSGSADEDQLAQGDPVAQGAAAPDAVFDFGAAYEPDLESRPDDPRPPTS